MKLTAIVASVLFSISAFATFTPEESAFEDMWIDMYFKYRDKAFLICRDSIVTGNRKVGSIWVIYHNWDDDYYTKGFMLTQKGYKVKAYGKRSGEEFKVFTNDDVSSTLHMTVGRHRAKARNADVKCFKGDRYLHETGPRTRIFD